MQWKDSDKREGAEIDVLRARINKKLCNVWKAKRQRKEREKHRKVRDAKKMLTFSIVHQTCKERSKLGY